MGLLDSIGEGLTYISKDAKEDRAYERELGQAEKKARLAMKLEEEFAARKYELAQKYPEMKSTINNNAGTIFGVMSDNSLRELNKNQALEDAVISGKAAPAERVNLLEQRVPYQNAVDEAKAGELTTRSPDRNRAIDAKEEATTIKTAADQEKDRLARIAKLTTEIVGEREQWDDPLTPQELQSKLLERMKIEDGAAGVSATTAPVAGVKETGDNPFAKYQKQ